MQTLASAYQRDRSVQTFFAELSDLWHQLDGMSTFGCPTCIRCTTIAQEKDHLRMYEFLMRLRPKFKSVRAQMMHQAAPPSLRDSLAAVIAEKTRLHSLEGMHHYCHNLGHICSDTMLDFEEMREISLNVLNEMK